MNEQIRISARGPFEDERSPGDQSRGWHWLKRTQGESCDWALAQWFLSYSPFDTETQYFGHWRFPVHDQTATPGQLEMAGWQYSHPATLPEVAA